MLWGGGSKGDTVLLGKWDATPSDLPFTASNHYPNKPITLSSPINISQYRKLGIELVGDCYYSNADHLYFDTGTYVERDINSCKLRYQTLNSIIYNTLSTGLYPLETNRTELGQFAGWIYGRAYFNTNFEISSIQFMCRELTQTISSDYLKFTILLYGIT